MIELRSETHDRLGEISGFRDLMEKKKKKKKKRERKEAHTVVKSAPAVCASSMGLSG